ncbi:MAG: hypothetical protein MZV65_42665, partial [Chromatiales bacterium]|nr:hypothetical protein [Chromatiales bacterium]
CRGACLRARSGRSGAHDRIGDFIDAALPEASSNGYCKRADADLGEVLCFGMEDRPTRFRPIKAVIRHPLHEPLYEVKSAYGRSVARDGQSQCLRLRRSSRSGSSVAMSCAKAIESLRPVRYRSL